MNIDEYNCLKRWTMDPQQTSYQLGIKW